MIHLKKPTSYSSSESDWFDRSVILWAQWMKNLTINNNQCDMLIDSCSFNVNAL